jgi:hypothetical protein
MLWKIEKMPIATKKSAVRKRTLSGLSREVEKLRERLEDLEDLRDLDAAVARNAGKPGIPREKVESELGLS